MHFTPPFLTIRRKNERSICAYDRIKMGLIRNLNNYLQEGKEHEKSSGKLCAFAIGVAAIAPECCRGNWYEPEEPEGLEEVLKKSGKVQ